jgi:cytoskeletal protein CcmA (bactofilin family)
MALMTKDTPTTAGQVNDIHLGEGAEFEGKLTFKGTVRIDARFKGSIVTNDVLVVGENAKIDAEINCGTVIIQGEVNGNIKAKTAVELKRPGRLRGNIDTPSLVMEKGVVFQGEVRMENLDRPATTTTVPPPAKPVGAGATTGLQ